MVINKELKKRTIKVQQQEITGGVIYRAFSTRVKDQSIKNLLERISRDEFRHYEFWKKITCKEVSYNKIKVFFYILILRIFGLTFGIKLLEKGEELTQTHYTYLEKFIPGIRKMIQDEERHEKELIELIDEERLKYIGSMVLGLNDALVELTGVLAGLTLALQNTRLVALVGLITGIAAAMSMASSEYLSIKQEGTKNPLKAGAYTGFTYLITVAFLIFPYFIFKNIFLCLLFVIFNTLLMILIFIFYISVAKDLSFKRKFLEMAGISLSIAFINFLIGIFIRKAFGIDV
jgi:VIT1/CCC1 family predicted Fe2+/Mn2+ transporter